ncbi:MAG: hypothetical protein JJE04_01520 [Acidobacteriia bacterium]|nr:hypothetical protein [Terriglobia bacterium]
MNKLVMLVRARPVYAAKVRNVSMPGSHRPAWAPRKSTFQLSDVSTGGRQLIVAPAKPSMRRQKFDAAQDWAHKRYEKAFRKLAQ